MLSRAVLVASVPPPLHIIIIHRRAVRKEMWPGVTDDVKYIHKVSCVVYTGCGMKFRGCEALYKVKMVRGWYVVLRTVVYHVIGAVRCALCAVRCVLCAMCCVL